MTRLRIYRWKAGNANLAELRMFAGWNYVAVDPGNNGAVYSPSPRYIQALFGGAANSKVATTCARPPTTCLMIAESQFSKRNPKTAIDLGMSLGILAGQVHEAGELNTHMVLVAPATWQAHQRKRQGVQLKRGEGIQLAMEVAERELGTLPAYIALRPEDKEGVASAFGIHQWWAHVMGQ